MLTTRISIAIALLAGSLTACGGGSPSEETPSFVTPPQTTANPAGSGAIESRSFVTYDVVLASDIDNERIAFTVHEPDEIVAGQSYPLVLHSHGYSGRRQIARPLDGLMGSLLANGYGVLSIDERGHGARADGSGGTIRILDPNFEGKDLMQMMDWTEDNLDWMAVRAGNPVIGAIGGSYGGGYQHLIYRLDPDKRLDAITPDITWNDLRYSLFSNQVFKTFWAGVLSAGGNLPQNASDPEVNQGLAEGLSANTLADSRLELLYNNSIGSNCNGDRPQDPALTPIPTLYSQSVIDTLFNFTEAWRNVQCLSDLGGDVRLIMKPAGHSGGGHERCGEMESNDARIAFFNEYLKLIPGAADFVPDVCYQLDSSDPDSTDGITVNSILVGGTTAPEVSANNLALSTASSDITHLPLITIDDSIDAEEDGDIIAGIPTITITVSDPLVTELTDPIMFVGISRSTDGGQTFTTLHDQVTPFRGFGTFTTELIGVLERVNHDDVLALAIHSGHPGQYASSGSRPAASANITANVELPLIGADHPAPATSN